MVKMWTSLLVFLSLAVCSPAESPGMKAIVTDKGLKFGTQVGTEWLQAHILQARIPDISGDVSLSVLGYVHYTLSRMSVARLNLPLPSVAFSEGAELQVGLTGLNMAVIGRWSTRYHFLRNAGTFRLGLFEVQVSAQLQVGRDEQGRLNVSSVRCSSSIGSISILFRGRSSWILQLFVAHFKGQIQSQVQERICPAVAQGVQLMESHLAAMNVSFPVRPDLLLDLALTSSPAVQKSDLNLDLKGEFYRPRTHAEPPFAPQEFQLPPQDNSMLSLGVSEFCLNSAAFAYWSAGLLQANITDKMIPPGSPIHLNTTSFGVFVPQLPKLFPNMLMLLDVYTPDPPAVSFLPDNATLLLSASAKAYAIRPDSTLAPLFRLDLSANFSGKFFVNDRKLKGSVMLSNLTLTLGASEVGTFQTVGMRNMLVMAVTKLVLPKLNAPLKAGVPIPAYRGLPWSNMVLKLNKGFMAIATDVAISSPGGQEH